MSDEPDRTYIVFVIVSEKLQANGEVEINETL